MHVYISGPIAGMPIDERRQAFADAALEVKNSGHTPLNPFDIPVWEDCSCDLNKPQFDGHAWGCYLRADIVAMLKCDGIYMLSGWENSHGARLELSVAAACGLTVYFSAESLEVLY